MINKENESVNVVQEVMMEAEVGEVKTFGIDPEEMLHFENVEQTVDDEDLEMQNNHHFPETSEELSKRFDPLHECNEYGVSIFMQARDFIRQLN